MQIEEVLSSRPRIKILKLLDRLGAVNVTEIARRVGLNFTTADKHLRILQQEGILKESTYGRVRMYKYDESSPKAKSIRNLIEIWEQENKKDKEKEEK